MKRNNRLKILFSLDNLLKQRRLKNEEDLDYHVSSFVALQKQREWIYYIPKISENFVVENLFEFYVIE